MAISKPKHHSQRKWDGAHPQARWAHAALKSAIRRGLVEKQGCAVCGSPDAEGHHPDYDRPAYVIWLCRLHHQQEHRRLKREAAE